MRYVALLRAVNVGGRKLPMAELRADVAALGFTDVETYIQSGNVVFAAKKTSPSRLAADLEAAIGVPVIVRTAAEMAAVVNARPKFDEKTLHVTFLATKPAATVKALDPRQYAPDVYAVNGLEVYVSCPNGYGTTKINNTFFEKRLRVVATTRNWRTVTTLATMAGT